MGGREQRVHFVGSGGGAGWVEVGRVEELPLELEAMGSEGKVEVVGGGPRKAGLAGRACSMFNR